MPDERYSLTSRTVRLLAAITALGCLVLSFRVVTVLRSIIVHGYRLPLWDMACHGVDGLRLAEHLRSFAPHRFLLEINRMGMWPPVFPLLEAPVFLIVGRDYAVAETFVSVLFAAGVMVAFVAGFVTGAPRLSAAGRWGGLAAGAVMAALFSLSPIGRAYGSVVMLEVPGVLLLLACLVAWMRHEGEPSPRRATVVAILTLALFLCKYNYGILWMVAMAVTEATKLPGGAPACARRVRREVGRPWLRSSFGIYVLSVLALVVIIVLTGGWSGRIGRTAVSVRSPANVALLLGWSLAAAALLHPRRNLREWRRLLRELPPLWGRFLAIVGAPVFLWLLVPSHMIGFVNFVGNRDSGIPLLSPEGLLYYIRSFLVDYSPTLWVGWVALAGGVLGAIVLWTRAPRMRILPVGLAGGFVLTTLHRYKDPRFFFTVAPFFWACGAAGLVVLLSIGRDRTRQTLGRVAAVTLAIVILAGAILFDDDTRAVETRRARLSVAPEVHAVLDDIARTALDARGSVFMGAWNELSPALVEWHCRIIRPGLRGEALPRSPRKILRSLEPRGLLDRIAADSRLDCVILLQLEPGAPAWSRAFVSETDWLVPVANAISRDGRFTLSVSRDYPQTGYRLLVYTKTGVPSELTDSANREGQHNPNPEVRRTFSRRSSEGSACPSASLTRQEAGVTWHTALGQRPAVHARTQPSRGLYTRPGGRFLPYLPESRPGFTIAGPEAARRIRTRAPRRLSDG